MNPAILEFYSIQQKLTNNVPTNFKRYLFTKINWDNRMIAIAGARGVGKTTMILQYIIEKYNDPERCIYISADNPFLLKEGLYEIGREHFKYKGECIVFDEIHKYENWSDELKALYDAYPDKRFIILGSSKLNILNQKSDLSRRMIIYNLKMLSFREYLILKHEINTKPFLLEEILNDPTGISSRIIKDFPNILSDFQEYLKFGCFPFFLEFKSDEYYSVLNNIIDKVIYEDIPTIKEIKFLSSIPIKKLIAFLAMSPIPTLNLSSLCNEIGSSRETLYTFLDLLERADLINIAKKRDKNLGSFKYARFFFYNSNYYYAIANEKWTHTEANKGNVREAFFVSQLEGAYPIFTSYISDYSVDVNPDFSAEIEIGGKNKGNKQIRNAENGFVFKDDQKIGGGNIIPLYLAGFLY